MFLWLTSCVMQPLESQVPHLGERRVERQITSFCCYKNSFDLGDISATEGGGLVPGPHFVNC